MERPFSDTVNRRMARGGRHSIFFAGRFVPRACSGKPSTTRGFLLALLLGGSLLFAASFIPVDAWSAPEHEIKLATLAPENSTLMKIFNEMNGELQKETNGKAAFKIFSGFALGDEEDVLRKLRVGMIHAASFTMAALTDVNPDLRALQVPFLFDNFREVDHVLQKMDADLRKGFGQKGMEVLGWPELGFIYFMSTHPVAGLEDLKGRKVWARANAPMSEALIDKIGVSTVAINSPDILMALQTNLVDVVYNSPYYAVATQWNTQVKFLTDLPLAYIGGVLVMDKKAYSKLPPPVQETLKEVCGKYARLIVEKTRQDNAEAMNLILARGVKRVTPSPEQAKDFKRLSDEAMASMDPKIMPFATLKKVRAILGEIRGTPSKP